MGADATITKDLSVLILGRYLLCKHIPLVCARPRTGRELNPQLVRGEGTSPRPEPLGTGAVAAEGSGAPGGLKATSAAPLAPATATAHQLYSARPPQPPPASEHPITPKAIPDPSQTLTRTHKFTNTLAQNTNYEELRRDDHDLQQNSRLNTSIS